MYRRAAIRDAVVTLVTGLPTTGANVTVGQVVPGQLPALPSLVVRAGADVLLEEQVRGPSASGKWLQQRAVQIVVEARAAGDGIEEQLDAIHLEVEQAVNVDKTLGGAADFITWSESPEAVLSDDLELVVGMRALLFMVHYRVDARDPQSLED